MLRNALLIVCCGLFATSSIAQEEASINTDAVLSWVRQLEDRQAAKRDEAERELMNAGPQILQHLPAITDRTNAEMKQRLVRIRDVLEAEQAAELTKATYVTLQGDMTLHEALKSIEKQTGNVVIDFRQRFNQPADDRKLALDIDNQPFWNAFDELADEAGVAIYSFVGELRKLAVVAAGEDDVSRVGRADYQGLFRIEPTSLSCQRNLRNANGDILRLTVELIWEPRVLPVLVRQDLEDIRVLTDTGESVGVQQTGIRQIPIQPGVASLDIQIPLSLPSREAKELKSCEGKFVALVPAGDVTFEFDDLVKGQGTEKTRRGLTVVLDDIRLNQGLQQISLRVRFDASSDSVESHLDWVENNVVRLVDPNGKPADEPGYERYFERDAEIGFRYIFPVEEKDLKGWKLIYSSPAGVAEVDVPFKLSEIPLP